jgi:hypothetical protein
MKKLRWPYHSKTPWNYQRYTVDITGNKRYGFNCSDIHQAHHRIVRLGKGYKVLEVIFECYTGVDTKQDKLTEANYRLVVAAVNQHSDITWEKYLGNLGELLESGNRPSC